MAYIHKMTIYFIDPTEESTIEDIKEELFNNDWLPSSHITSAETKEFQWADDVIVNKRYATNKDYNDFFDNL